MFSCLLLDLDNGPSLSEEIPLLTATAAESLYIVKPKANTFNYKIPHLKLKINLMVCLLHSFTLVWYLMSARLCCATHFENPHLAILIKRAGATAQNRAMYPAQVSQEISHTRAYHVYRAR